MRIILIIGIFISGYLTRTLLEEAVNYKNVHKYNECRKTLTKDQTWLVCKHLLDYRPVESILLYQPEWWDR